MALERIGMQDVKAGYDLYNKYPYYAIFESSTHKEKTGQLLYAYREDDRNGQGWEILKQNLEVIEQNGPTDIHILRFYDEDLGGKRIDSNTPYAGSFRFRMQQFAPAMSTRGGGGGFEIMNQLFASKLELLDQKWGERFRDQEREHQKKVEELEAELETADQDDETEIGRIKSIGSVIGELGEQFPWMQDPVKKIVNAITDIFSNHPHGHAGMGSVPGQAHDIEYEDMTDTTTNAEEQLNKEVQRLMTFFVKNYGNPATTEGRQQGVNKMVQVFHKLGEMADTNPAKLKGLLMML